ncbi:MAG: hypothetical protein PWP23_3347 [Candidatus Sumerlaeota bacterium]|nr:hypothetical protein [Candidatus Sumerlaeota bacterium]
MVLSEESVLCTSRHGSSRPPTGAPASRAAGHKARASVLLLLFLLLFASAQAEVAFDSSFESGNATGFVQTGPTAYDFTFEPDTNSSDRQWFAFDVSGAAGMTLTFRLTQTNLSNVPGHWNTALPVASKDGGATWEFVTGSASNTSTTYTFSHTFTASPERIAFHFPYTWSYLVSRVAEWEQHPHVTREIIGQSVGGRAILLLHITNPEAVPAGGKKVFWFVTRQHAAEVTGSYLLDGLMEQLLADDETGRALRDGAEFFVAPMLNPDGVVAGNYRDNQAGVNLNRVWNNPSASTSPEVLAVTNRIDAWMAAGNRIDYFADLHSTSGASPHFAFHASSAIQPALYPTPATYSADSKAFLALLEEENPGFDAAKGSSGDTSEKLARQWITFKYGVFAFTFEGGYNKVNHGPNASARITPQDHRDVGRALARALVRRFDLQPAERADAWLVPGGGPKVGAQLATPRGETATME